MKAFKIVGIILAVALATYFGSRLLPQLSPLSGVAAQDTGATALVERGAVEETVSANGTVATNREARLVLSMSGRVEEVLVVEGQRVSAGDPLIRLDSGALEDQVARARASLDTVLARLEQAKAPASQGELAQVEASLAQARRPASVAEIAAAQAGVDSAQANLDRLLTGPTQFELEKAKLNIDSARDQLWAAQASRDSTNGSQMASGAQKDSAEAQVLIAEIAVQQALVAQEQLVAPANAEDIAAAQAQLNQARAQLAQVRERPKAEEIALAEAQLAQLLERPRAADVAVAQASADEAALALAQAQDTLSDAELLAPFSGAVVDITVNTGEWAMAGASVVHLVDVDDLILEVLLDEVDVAKVAEGQRTILTFDALPRQKVTGTVTDVAVAATQTSGGVAYGVKVRFEAGDLPVRLGMTAKVDIVTARVEDVLLVPNAAVKADRAAGRYYVTRQTALGDETVEVTIGLRDDDHTQIVSGLAEGDTVALQTVELPTNDQQPGMPFGGMGGGR